MTKKPAKTILFILLAVIILCGTFLLGRITAPVPLTTTFYAVIESADGTHFLVDGLEVNDINSRGAFRFSIDQDTRLIWRHTEITAEDLDPGDTISITYTGPVQESDPARITDPVLRIDLLDDEK